MSDTRDGITITFLGCGNLGQAILRGILEASHNPSAQKPPVPIKRFIACVRHASSAKAIEHKFSDFNSKLSVLASESVRGVREADVILLGVEPGQFREVLEAHDKQGTMEDACRGKLMISILAGTTTSTIYNAINGVGGDKCRVVRVLPNTAAAIGAAMSVIEKPKPDMRLAPTSLPLVTYLFSCIGRVVTVEPHLMDVSTALAGSGPAFCALMLEGLIDGAVAMGMPRKEATIVATQVMKGTTLLVESGEHPALLREKITTAGGCTIGGLQLLEEKGVRGSIGRSIREATSIVGLLGQGKKGVNGTKD